MFEGEEELGSRNTGAFVQANKALLAADALLICDGPFSPRQPVIGAAVRGAVMGEVRLKGPPHDLHSGRYGGAVKNPLHYAARIIASFHDGSGRVQIKGFYDDVIPPSDRLIRHMNELWKTMGPSIQRAAGVDAFFGEYLGVFAERTTSKPTLDVNGIYGGHQSQGARAIIPADAGFKVTIRTVAGQDSDVDVAALRRACHGICRTGHRHRRRAARHRPSFYNAGRRARNTSDSARAQSRARQRGAAHAAWRVAADWRHIGAGAGCAGHDDSDTAQATILMRRTNSSSSRIYRLRSRWRYICFLNWALAKQLAAVD